MAIYGSWLLCVQVSQNQSLASLYSSNSDTHLLWYRLWQISQCTIKSPSSDNMHTGHSSIDTSSVIRWHFFNVGNGTNFPCHRHYYLHNKVYILNFTNVWLCLNLIKICICFLQVCITAFSFQYFTKILGWLILDTIWIFDFQCP